MSDASTRMDRLARRVRWTEWARRPISVVLALVLSPLLMHELQDALETAWPLAGYIVPLLMFAAVLWWAIEAAFALQMALWETEYDRLSRDLGLPPARVVIRRRRRK